MTARVHHFDRRETVVQALERLLTRARAGEIESVAYVHVDDHGRHGYGWHHKGRTVPNARFVELTGLVSLLHVHMAGDYLGIDMPGVTIDETD